MNFELNEQDILLANICAIIYIVPSTKPVLTLHDDEENDKHYEKANAHRNRQRDRKGGGRRAFVYFYVRRGRGGFKICNYTRIVRYNLRILQIKEKGEIIR